MLEAGIFEDDEPLELLNGELIVVSPQGPSHRTLTVITHQLLAQAYGTDVHVQDHSPIMTSEYSLPEPDVAIIRGAPRDYLDRLPGPDDVLLVVEIAVTNLPAAQAKVAIYAAAGVPAYWLVDVTERVVIVHTDPDPEPDSGSFLSVIKTTTDGAITPPDSPTSIPVSALLP